MPTPVSQMVRVLSSLLGTMVIFNSFSDSSTGGSVRLWYRILSSAYIAINKTNKYKNLAHVLSATNIVVHTFFYLSPAWFISPVTATSGYGKHKEYAVAWPLSKRAWSFSYAVDGIYLTIGCPLGTDLGSEPLGQSSMEAVVPLRCPRRLNVCVPQYSNAPRGRQMRAHMATHTPGSRRKGIHRCTLTSEQLEISSLKKISLLE